MAALRDRPSPGHWPPNGRPGVGFRSTKRWILRSILNPEDRKLGQVRAAARARQTISVHI